MAEQLDIFTPFIDEKALIEKMKAAGFDFEWDNVPTYEYCETCPKCDAAPGDLCTRRGKPIDSHYGRRQVAGLRFEKGWVPKAGECVKIGYFENKAKPAIFKRFTSKGEVEVDDLGAGWRYKRFDSYAVWPRSA